LYKKKITFLFVCLAVSFSSFYQEWQINSVSEKEKQEGWKLLFNGKNLGGWKTFQGREISGWKIIDGVLNNSGVGSDHGGDIVTRERFGDFILSLEWKVAPRSNSGIFYHVNEKLGKAIYETGPEYQLIDDKGWPDRLNDDQYSGANYAMHPPQGAEVEELGEWNHAIISVERGHVQHFLNGVKVVDYHLWDVDWKARKEKGKWKDFPFYGMAKKGQIGLQDHGGLAQFRNIKIKVLN
jgi:hypothetical protein